LWKKSGSKLRSWEFHCSFPQQRHFFHLGKTNPDEKQAFKIRIVEAEESVKSAIGLIEVEELKLLVYESLKASELLLEIANKSLDDSWDLKNQEEKMGWVEDDKAEKIKQRRQREIAWRVARQAYKNSLLLLAQYTPQLKQLNHDATKLEEQLTEQFKEDSSQKTREDIPTISVEAFEQQIKEILTTTEPTPNLILGVRAQEPDWYFERYGHPYGRPSKFSDEEKQAWRTIHQSGESVVQTQPNRDRHTYIIGKSGSGKTTLMLNMIYQDLKAGNGLGVIAPEQEMLTEQILPYIPDNRLEDVIYFNPADENPVPFNPLNLDPDEDADLKANEVMTIFKRIIGTEGTPRIDEILRQSIYALLTTPNTTNAVQNRQVSVFRKLRVGVSPKVGAVFVL